MKYFVIMNTTIGGIIYVNAKSKKQAREKAEEKLNNDGENAFVDVVHRDNMFCGFNDRKINTLSKNPGPKDQELPKNYLGTVRRD